MRERDKSFHNALETPQIHTNLPGTPTASLRARLVRLADNATPQRCFLQAKTGGKGRLGGLEKRMPRDGRALRKIGASEKFSVPFRSVPYLSVAARPVQFGTVRYSSVQFGIVRARVGSVWLRGGLVTGYSE